MSISEAKKRFMSHPSDEEKQFIAKGVADGTLITTEHGSIDEAIIMKKMIEEHDGDDQWSAKEYLKRTGVQ
jgi:hypothetical protein